MTAHAHFKNGCPMLALEVLTKLPQKIDDENSLISHTTSSDDVTTKRSSLIRTGTLDQPTLQTRDEISTSDWSKQEVDWSQPARRFSDDELKLDWSDSNGDESGSDEDNNIAAKNSSTFQETPLPPEQAPTPDSEPEESGVKGQKGAGDIMALQLRYIACLKIMVEELSTLATGFEVDGGQLRYQLFAWLENEVEILKRVTNYGLEQEAEASASETG